MADILRKEICDQIIANGINNLKDFGYPDVDKDNIFTDMVYSRFFKNMLRESLERGFDVEINHLLSKIGR